MATCAVCRRQTAAHFEVRRVGAQTATLTRVCSAVCLLRWGYDFTTRQGATGMALAANIVQKLLGGRQ